MFFLCHQPTTIVPIRAQTGPTIAPTSAPVSSPLPPPLPGVDVGVDVETGVAVVSMDVCDGDDGVIGLAVIVGVGVKVTWSALRQYLEYTDTAFGASTDAVAPK